MRQVLVLAAMVAFASPASAQTKTGAEAAGSQTAGVDRYVAVLRACRAEAARFCSPGSDQSSGRNQAICLRPYRSNLSSGCRRAVVAAMP